MPTVMVNPGVEPKVIVAELAVDVPLVTEFVVPSRIDVPDVKPVPVTVRPVPPENAPLEGVTALTVGFA